MNILIIRITPERKFSKIFESLQKNSPRSSLMTIDLRSFSYENLQRSLPY